MWSVYDDMNFHSSEKIIFHFDIRYLLRKVSVNNMYTVLRYTHIR